MNFFTEDLLSAIAFDDKEEGNQRKNKKWSVHPAGKNVKLKDM